MIAIEAGPQVCRRATSSGAGSGARGARPPGGGTASLLATMADATEKPAGEGEKPKEASEEAASASRARGMAGEAKPGGRRGRDTSSSRAQPKVAMLFSAENMRHRH